MCYQILWAERCAADFDVKVPASIAIANASASLNTAQTMPPVERILQHI